MKSILLCKGAERTSVLKSGEVGSGCQVCEDFVCVEELEFHLVENKTYLQGCFVLFHF